MGIREKILISFSITTILLFGAALLFIHTLFAGYREEEFQQRQKEKIKSTLLFLTEVKQADTELTEAIDRLTINDLYNEKLLIFDSGKALIYSSIDDTPISYSEEILTRLNAENNWYETKDGNYDVVGLYFENNGNVYYGISKAYDKFGYSKLNYLNFVLWATLFAIVVLLLLIAFILSNQITKPLVAITGTITNYDFDGPYTPIDFEQSKDEIATLAQQFNMLMKRMNDVFAFQKHAIHHISHELKTPIAILVSNFERIENATDFQEIKHLINYQKEDTKNLSEIINSLLEIAKAESGSAVMRDDVRIDEMIFDVADELKNIHTDFQFQIEYTLADDANNLTLLGNAHLLKAAILNLMNNCIYYSDNQRAKITIGNAPNGVNIVFENTGALIKAEESQYLFQHFFRGDNSKGKRGFGLGLVFIQKIIALHGGHVFYSTKDNTVNVFTISLPLS